MQRIRIRYAKRGPLRFTSHRDFARAFERALRAGQRAHRVLAGLHPAPEDLVRQRGADRGGQRGGVPGDRPAGAGSTRPSCARRWTRRSRPGLDVLEAVEAAPAGAAWPTGSTRRTGGSSCPRSTPATLRGGRGRLPRRRRGAGRAADQAGPRGASTPGPRSSLIGSVGDAGGTCEVAGATVCDTRPCRTAGHPVRTTR